MQSVLDRERRGDYLGKTVQVVPHITGGGQGHSAGCLSGECWLDHVRHTQGLMVGPPCVVQVRSTLWQQPLCLGPLCP
jgi:hypothetical protein